jgi:signal transduction histidine kinase
LPLAHDSVLIGLLRLQCRPDHTLSAAHKDFLNSITSQLALALALSIAFPQQVIEVQRSERRRLAYELHDSLAQEIGYLHLGLDRLADDERLKNTEWLQAELDRLRVAANDAYLEVRNNLALLQRPGETDLGQALENYIRSVSPQVSYQIEFHTSGSAALLEPLTTQHVLGLIQESLNNVQKHARAQRAQINLKWLPKCLHITVADDGVGFDLAAVPASGHYGLATLRERAQELRGEMQIKSAPGAGTTLQFEIPLKI